MTPIGATSGMAGAFASPAARAAVDPALADRQQDFSAILSRARSSDKPAPEAARETAQQFVAMTLVQPILAQLRSTNEAAEPFKPSSAERQFQSMLDADLAQRISRATGFGLVDQIAHRLLRGAPVQQEARP